MVPADWNPRSLQLDLDFLEAGNYKIQIWKDGVNADKHASDFKMEEMTVTNTSKIKIDMAPGGGWAAVIKQL